MFGLFQKKSVDYFNSTEKAAIVEAIRLAELKTSGEVRIYIEGKCKQADPVDRAREIFHQLKMDKTQARNGVLIYMAMKDRRLSVYGDEGIHNKVGFEFWNSEIKTMLAQFNQHNYTDGLVQIIQDIGEALVLHFPYDATMDKNELPDDIVFGK